MPADRRLCEAVSSSGFDSDKVADETWQALVEVDAFVEGLFILASGVEATLKVDAERLYNHPRQLKVVMRHFATFPCVTDADVLLYVPDGMRDFVTALAVSLDKPIAHTKRRPGATTKYDFEFASPDDEELACAARKSWIGEDVVSTLGSIAALRALLPPDQDVHSLAILRRGVTRPSYRKGLTDHYLLERTIPLDADQFKEMYPH